MAVNKKQGQKTRNHSHWKVLPKFYDIIFDIIFHRKKLISMKIIVVEDNKDFNELICKKINKILIKKGMNYEVIPFYKYDSKLDKIIHSNETNIYILDIELGSKSGYDICRAIRESAYDWNSIIIISSSHNQKENIISLRLSIFTYLSKLINFEQDLKDAVIDAIQIIENQNWLMIDRNNKIAICDICYILREKDSHYCCIKTVDNETYRTRKSIQNIETELHLEKINSYLLINNKNIKSMTKRRITFKNKIVLDI